MGWIVLVWNDREEDFSRMQWMGWVEGTLSNCCWVASGFEWDKAGELSWVSCLAHWWTHRPRVGQDGGAIAGGVIGAFFVLGLIAAAAVGVTLFLKRKYAGGACGWCNVRLEIMQDVSCLDCGSSVCHSMCYVMLFMYVSIWFVFMLLLKCNYFVFCLLMFPAESKVSACAQRTEGMPIAMPIHTRCLHGNMCVYVYVFAHFHVCFECVCISGNPEFTNAIMPYEHVS